MNAWCQEELSKLQPLSGSEFDREFARGAIQGHAMAIAKLQKDLPEITDSDLADYTRDMLSELKRHQNKTREIAKAVGLDQATIAALETQPPEGVGTPGASQTEHGTSSREQDHKETKDRDLQHEP